MKEPNLKGSLLRDTQVTRDPERPCSFHGDIPEAWRAVHAFGGVILAVGLRAIEVQLSEPSFVPLYVSAIFARPVPCGPVHIHVDPLAKSPSVAHAVARLHADDEPSPNVHLQATFGKPMSGRRTFCDVRFPEGIRSPADSFANGASVADSFPNLQQSELRWAYDFCNRPGAPPPLAPQVSEPAVASSWIRYHDPPLRPDGFLDPIALAAPADCMGAALLRGLGTDIDPFFQATVAMDIHFFGTSRQTWLLQHARVWRLLDGYATGVLELWDQEQNLLAIATQRRICKGLPRAREH